jgi:hypothetical protein
MPDLAHSSSLAKWQIWKCPRMRCAPVAVSHLVLHGLASWVMAVPAHLADLPLAGVLRHLQDSRLPAQQRRRCRRCHLRPRVLQQPYLPEQLPRPPSAVGDGSQCPADAPLLEHAGPAICLWHIARLTQGRGERRWPPAQGCTCTRQPTASRNGWSKHCPKQHCEENVCCSTYCTAKATAVVSHGGHKGACQ